MNIVQEGVGIQGDQVKFAQYGHLATRLLELLREGLNGPIPEYEQEEQETDNIVGRYCFVDPPVWGRTKVFYETSGSGPQQILFCHTAGSDSRQYHGVMNDKRMMEKCTMIAFDLPAHGRSFPGKNYIPGNHTNNEESYVGCIREVIKVLKLDKPIVCGASMAGQVAVAVAIRAEEVGAGGTIPLQGCDYLTMERQFQDKSPVVNQSLFNPDWVYGMMCPKSPYVNRQLIWHMYSGQAYGIVSLSRACPLLALTSFSSMATLTSTLAALTPEIGLGRSTSRSVRFVSSSLPKAEASWSCTDCGFCRFLDGRV